MMAKHFILDLLTAAKVGSILVHADEASSPGGHPFDINAIRSLIDDPDVQKFLNALASEALIPLKR